MFFALHLCQVTVDVWPELSCKKFGNYNFSANKYILKMLGILY